MFRNFNLTFPEDCIDYVRSAYENAETIVEYGSGGSTLYAASKRKTIITVESNAGWLLELMGAYKENGYEGDIIPLWADIGPTKQWGYPDDETGWQRWNRYSRKPWIYCREHKIHPDTVLVDGRFRVACFLSTCVFITKPTTLIFDDFFNRKQYHVVHKIAQPVKQVGERMAVFELKPGLVTPEFLLRNIELIYKPA